MVNTVVDLRFLAFAGSGVKMAGRFLSQLFDSGWVEVSYFGWITNAFGRGSDKQFWQVVSQN